MKNIKKIIILSQNLQGGGAERFCVNLGNELSSLGHNIQLVLLDKNKSNLIKKISEKINLLSLDTIKARYSILSLIAHLRKAKPDIVISNQRHINFLLIITMFFCKFKCKFFIREAASPSIEIKQKTFLFRLISKTFIKLLYRKVHKIISPSHEIKNDLINNFGIKDDKVLVLCNSINFDEIFFLSNNKDTSFLNFDSNKDYIISIGRLTKQKNYFHLLDCFSIILKDYDINLLILGEGEDRIKIEEKVNELGIKENVVMPGHIENPYFYLKRAKIFVLTSIYEGMPNVLLEAASFNLQIISSDCPTGPREILNNGKWGKLIEVNNISALTDALNEGMKGKIKKIPLDEVKKRYDVKKIAKNFVKFF